MYSHIDHIKQEMKKSNSDWCQVVYHLGDYFSKFD